MDRRSRIFVAGGNTLVGAALIRELQRQGYTNLLAAGTGEPALVDADAVDAFFARTAPECVFFAGGKSGGILANQMFPADLMLDNLLVACHVIDSAFRHGVRQFLYLASSCCYPRDCPQPMQTKSLLTGYLEPTSEAYALAKLAGVGLCRAYAQQHGVRFITAIPGDVFGPGDDFGPEGSHVIPALIRRMHEARLTNAPSVAIWGTGAPRRDFLYVDDLADACIFVMAHYEGSEPINLGGGSDLSIAELAQAVKEVVGYKGNLHFDTSKPDGMPFKALDSSQLQVLGWRPITPFQTALRKTSEWFLLSEPAYIR